MRPRNLFTALAAGLGFVFILSTSYATDCTKDEIMRLLEAGYSKQEISRICEGAPQTPLGWHCCAGGGIRCDFTLPPFNGNP